MVDETFRSEILSILKCAFSTNDDEHLCQEPLLLSCGHHICKTCLQPEVNYNTIKCCICNEINKRDLNQEQKLQMFNFVLKSNLNTLFAIIYEKLKTTLNTYTDMIYNSEETIDLHIQFVKDEIQLKIESIKIELDNIYEAFNKELEEIKVKWKSECENMDIGEFDRTKYENELRELEENIKNQTNFSNDRLYYHQNQLKSIRKMIQEYKSQSPRLDFTEGSLNLKKDLIGGLTFEIGRSLDVKLLNAIENNKFNQVNVGCNLHYATVLPNGHFLLANFEDSSLLLYDANFKLLKTVTTINGKKFRIISVTNDSNNCIFLSNYGNHNVIKTDSEFNQLAIFGNGAGSATNQVNYPYGMCYYDKYVFVCDYGNNRIQKLDSNLVFEASYQLNFHPWDIKNIMNYGIIRACGESSIYFYDLNSFNLLMKHVGHNGIIGVSKSHFYEYYASNKMLYCYNKNGDLIKNLACNGLGLSTYNNNGSICLFKSNFYFILNGNQSITVV